jgi:hypothetical protein
MQARGTRAGVLLTSAAILITGLLSGCTVPMTAVAGVGMGADGRPLGVIQVCSSHIDGATVYQTDSDHLGSWTSRPAASGFTRWSLDDGGAGWLVTEPFASLQQGQTYNLYGWTEANSASTVAVHFTMTDLARLLPGQVRYTAGSSDARGDLEVTVTEAYFKQHACDMVN